MFSLAVCAEMVFRDLSIEERARRIAAEGFSVEIWDWTRHDIEALARTGATFSSMTGYVSGDLVDDDGAGGCCKAPSARSRSPRSSASRASTCTAPGSTAAACRSGPSPR